MKRRPPRTRGYHGRSNLERNTGWFQQIPYSVSTLRLSFMMAIAFAVFIAYAPSLRGPFLFDDYYLPYTLPPSVNGRLWDWLGPNRPLLMFSYWLNVRLSGLTTFSYHLVGVLIHIGNGVLVYLLVRRLLELAKGVSFKSELVALCVASCFLLHPLQTESVSYIASRSETMSAFFVLAALVLFIYRFEQLRSTTIALSLLGLFLAGCLSKEQAIILPVILIVTDYYWLSRFSYRDISQELEGLWPLRANYRRPWGACRVYYIEPLDDGRI